MTHFDQKSNIWIHFDLNNQYFGHILTFKTIILTHFDPHFDQKSNIWIHFELKETKTLTHFDL